VGCKDIRMILDENVISLKGRRCKSGLIDHSPILVDPSLQFVECGSCKEKLDPIYVLAHMARRESMWRMRLAKIREQTEDIENRNRCKCKHCGKMTDIVKLRGI